MDLLGLLSCVLFFVVAGNASTDIDEELEWPDKYTFEAEVISLTAGSVDDVQYWRTKTKSRIDYNKGAVKKYASKPRLKSRFHFGVEYEVHPETTENNENYLVCKRTNGTKESMIFLEDVLPDEYLFEHEGSEVVNQDTVEKFVYTEVESKKTIWAIYNKSDATWAPVKYEVIEYDMWLGLKKQHDIWNFHNFETNFKSSDVFNFEDVYACKDTEPQPDELSKSRNDNINPNNKHHVDQIFNSFKEKHNKIYADEKEHSLRRNLFQKRMRLVIENNSKNTGYKLAINKFADRTPEELKKYTGLVRSGQRESDTHPFPYTAREVKNLASNLPVEYDLRDEGLVTPVKDQRSCGSCWTFGTTSAVEGALARKNGGRLIRLSNQALLDCAWGFGNSGCDGGYDIGAYHWMMNYGLPTEEEYGSYANKEGFCHMDNMTEVYQIRGFTNVTPFSVEALKVAVVNHGPLSVSIHAYNTLYQYQGGIYYEIECDASELNHEVTLVGYGQRDGEEYWIVKNSWGQNWGVDGYFYLSTRDNNCGITTEPTYPVL